MNKKENKPQEEAKKQDKSQNQPKESFIGTGNGSSLRSRKHLVRVQGAL